MGFTNNDIEDLSGPSKPGVTTVYARATHAALEAAVEKLIEPIAQSGRVRAKGWKSNRSSVSHRRIDATTLAV